MKSTIATLRTIFPKRSEQALKIMFEVGPKMREPFYFYEVTCPEYVNAITAIKKIIRFEKFCVIETSQFKYDLRKIK